jgi:hypothetical protein
MGGFDEVIHLVVADSQGATVFASAEKKHYSRTFLAGHDGIC